MRIKNEMKARFVHKGEALEYVNDTDKDIAAGDPIAFGAHTVIAGTDIPVGAKGSLETRGVFLMPKDGAAIDRGAEVYLDADGKVTATKSDTVAGVAEFAAAAEDTIARIRIDW